MSDRWPSKIRNFLPTGRILKKILSLAVVAAICFCLVVWGHPASNFLNLGAQSAVAQAVQPQEAAKQVYERIPDLPLENQYISKQTGEVAVNNTLVNRLIRYHLYVKSRPPNYRLDWKLTLADYLGANENPVETQYPGYDSLQKSPMDADKAIIRRLNRAKREKLIEVLVSIFAPNKPSTPAPSPSASPQPSTTPNPRATPSLPKPGDAQLLR